MRDTILKDLNLCPRLLIGFRVLMKHDGGYAKKIWAKNRAYSINFLSCSEDSWEFGAGSQSRPFLDRLNFIDIDQEDRAFLQPSFSDEEMVAALRNMVGDKGPSPHWNCLRRWFQSRARIDGGVWWEGTEIVYTSVCLADVPSEPSDFFPLFVNYQERFSAAGRTSGGFFKREGRAKDHELVLLGSPKALELPVMPMLAGVVANGKSEMAGRKIVAGSGIEGMKGSQKMIDLCAKHNIIADVEIIRWTT
ncbi:hypothetical protein RJ639_017341 [Escallonia herrerae]|uniref:Uncharacterized protein n=1 Tax=Escallonia herrerae TaxID=1293975 RepID=A0AA88VF55_9ASTE|nr:hypothetical protein RJ639_017341 [Escallonia herrerae]